MTVYVGRIFTQSLAIKSRILMIFAVTENGKRVTKMTPEKAIKTIQVAIAEVEWNYPLDYAIAFETAIKALKSRW